MHVSRAEGDHPCWRRRINDGARGGCPAGAVRHGAKVGGLQVSEAEIRRADAENDLFCRDRVAITQPPDRRAASRCVVLECHAEERLCLVNPAEGGPLLSAEDLHRHDRISAVVLQDRLRPEEVDVGVDAAQRCWKWPWDGSRGAIKFRHAASVAVALHPPEAGCATPRVARLDRQRLRAVRRCGARCQGRAGSFRRSRSTQRSRQQVHRRSGRHARAPQ